MILSMTGFGVASRELGRNSLHLELRGVNSRYLDLTFRICDELRHCEPMLRELISTRVTRGKLECRINLRTNDQATRSLELNTEIFEQLLQLNQQIQARLPGCTPLSAGEILRWPGLLSDEDAIVGEIQPAVMTLAREALDQFIDSRHREGEKLATMILVRVEGMRKLVTAAQPRVPVLVAEYQEKLTNRLREAVACLDEDRIRQEVALFAQRIDVAEELSRLQAHLTEVERILSARGPAGKRLDFLMQELNREANTLSSKSAAVDVTNIAMEMKVLIEQMREQVQNVE